LETEQTFPDVGAMNDEELKSTIDTLKDEERQVSYRRRLLHGQIDLLRAELVNRLKNKVSGGDEHISGGDVEALTDILLGKIEHPEEGG
jgi:RsiG-like